MNYGLFIHYGLYSQLAGYYQGKETPFYAEWIQHSLSIEKEEYAVLTQSFDPASFDADRLVEEALSFGFTYLVITAKHHEGFCLFDSQVTDYTAKVACGRDLIKELSLACQRKGMPLGLYYSQAQDWYHGGYKAYEERPETFEGYFEDICLPQVKELLTNYGPLELLWFDTPMDMREEEIGQLRDVVKSLQPNCQISGRIGRDYGDYLVTGDNMLPSLKHPPVWEVPMTLSTSWGYRKGDQWKDPQELLKVISKVFLRDGRVLLNIGPKADFSVPQEAVERLGYLKKPIEDLLFVLEKEEILYPYEDRGLLLFKEEKTLYVMILDGRDRLGLYNLLSKVKAVYQGDEEVSFKQLQTLEGDPYLALALPSSGPSLLTIHCYDEIGFLAFGQSYLD